MRKSTLPGLLAAALFCLLAVAPAAEATTAKLTYRGGPVMSAYNTVAVAWQHEGKAQGAALLEGLGGFLADVAAESGKAGASNVLAILPQYSTIGLTGGKQVAAYRSAYLGSAQIAPSTAATIQLSEIGAVLDKEIEAGHLPGPTADATGAPETAYVLAMPPNMAVCIQSSCSGPGVGSPQFCGTHGSATYGSTKYTFIIVPEISGSLAGGCGESATELNNQTSVLSHELSEVITDPLVSEELLSWYDDSNGELADICVTGSDETTDTINGHTWTVQKLWSNIQAQCVGNNSIFHSPTAEFGATPSVNTASFKGSGETSNHLATIPPTIASYSWDFGDGQAGSGATPSHAYAAAGTYPVRLTVTDGLGFTASITHAVTVSAPPAEGGSGSGGSGGSGSAAGPGAGGEQKQLPGGPLASIAIAGGATTSAHGSAVVVDSGQIVSCPAGSTACTVTIKVLASVGAHARSASARQVVVASKTLAVLPGHAIHVSFNLNSAGLKLLRHNHRLSVTLAVAVRVGAAPATTATRKLTLRAPKAGKHKH